MLSQHSLFSLNPTHDLGLFGGGSPVVRVTLVNPPYPKGAHAHIPFPQLGMGYLAAVLEKNGYTVDVIDCQALKLTLNEVENELHKRQPDIVGLTSTTLTYKPALEIIKAAKKAH